MAFEQDHPWTKSTEDCPWCGTRLEVMVCLEGSCRECLGDLAGYRCSGCAWSGDGFDLDEDRRAALAEQEKDDE